MRILIPLFAYLFCSHSVRGFSPKNRRFNKITQLSVSTSADEMTKETQFADKTRSNVEEYYGKTLQTSSDLKTNACITAGRPPKFIRECLKNVHPTVMAKYYGCGLCIPQYDLTGCNILDLGCGAGRDVYLAAQLVGANGRVVGVDMTDAQLDVAREYQDYHAEKFGYKNTAFYKGYLESLSDVKELEKGSFDVIISNCVINLCTDKEAVLKSCFELLKPGGELYFSDVYSNRRVPQVLREDSVLWGECISGALYWNDFENLAKKCGFPDPRLVEDAPVTIKNKDVQELVENQGHGGLEFYSATYRLFKMDETLLEPACEDYGQAVIYKGTIPRAATKWTLDKGHVFEQGKVHPVCGNTYNMCKHNPKIAPHFEFIGDFSTHYGIFEGCGGGLPYERNGASVDKSGGAASCC
ncbi:arsenite methyltransferase [Fistulifera solaris]|uniref:Arsenite methyltransferase n=1 Tax=Fistulifera solaris TaxID=1519565 RepID=A0A1Z5JZE3_FISSO|nr:arsenite methyltransferase [Fistulifera solaris]|eukprot:GAX19208.1 arsenite methyltransferase [Fistulifera solaris]